MSKEATQESVTTATTPTPTSPDEKRRSTMPDLLRHQRSFEKRYSHLITKQMLEKSINREVLQRQLDNFFHFERTPSMQEREKGEQRQQHQQGTSTEKNAVLEKQPQLLEESSEENLAEVEEATGLDETVTTTPTDAVVAELEEQQQRILQKLETLDIADKGEKDMLDIIKVNITEKCN